MNREKFIKEKALELYGSWHDGSGPAMRRLLAEAIRLGMANAHLREDVYTIEETQHDYDGTGLFKILLNDEMISNIWYGDSPELTRNKAQEAAGALIAFLRERGDE